ncbi:helix-turn-helix transcriptional regulator [Ascidiimonas aurantiaca]|uniref:helix-turn-helix transcriptional regulator n=1 Tax=Ascidiimonas aurantiaca TaxID=1685432 RepID=UPI0030EC3463
MKIVDRIKLFIEFKNISLRNFDESIGMSKGYMSRQIKSNASIGGDVLEKIIDAYPELNPVWLLKGKGAMLSPGSDILGPTDFDKHNIYQREDVMAKAISMYLDHPVVSDKLRHIIDNQVSKNDPSDP